MRVVFIVLAFLLVGLGLATYSFLDLASLPLLPFTGSPDSTANPNQAETSNQAVESPAPDDPLFVEESESAQRVLGVIDYPAITLPRQLISPFSPEQTGLSSRLSDEVIAQRCAHITIPLNHDRCINAERVCAGVLSSNNDHWKCLQNEGYFAGKELNGQLE